MEGTSELTVEENINCSKECYDNMCFAPDIIRKEALKLKSLEEEQEILTSSLFSLTTLFAQVQFRLHQIVKAPFPEREALLKSLEEFAFQGVNKIEFNCSYDSATRTSESECKSLEQKLIQLVNNENQEVDGTGTPQSALIERQKVIIEEIRKKINLNLEEIDRRTLSTDELREQLDRAIGEFVEPIKMKDALVNQLKTQIQDLERFIKFLQEGPDGKWNNGKLYEVNTLNSSNKDQKTIAFISSSKQDNHENNGRKIQSSTSGVLQKAAEFIQIFTSSQFGCNHFTDNKFKKNEYDHWGDNRAQLEVIVEEIILLSNQNTADDNYIDKIVKADYSISDIYDIKITNIVRKYLAVYIRNLMQHGLIPIVQSTSVVPFLGCFSFRSQAASKVMHAWEFILKYYHLKNGDLYNATPARCLSQSFNLSIMIGTSMSNKLSLLGAISRILADHSPYKSSYDSQFKAFICAALNANKLVAWLKLILQCTQLINMHYTPWSYVKRTGFRDSLQCLDKLTNHSFDLPVDLAVRKFHNIKDVFM